MAAGPSRRGRPRKQPISPIAIGDAVYPESDTFTFDELPDWLTKDQLSTLLEGLILLVPLTQSVVELLPLVKKRGRGRKPYLHFAVAIADCGELWQRVTGKDWRKVEGAFIHHGTYEDRLDRHPPIILARALLTVLGIPYAKTMERHFPRAKQLVREA